MHNIISWRTTTNGTRYRLPNIWTPWGPAQYVQRLAEGIDFMGTAGHGGIHLSPERQAQMPECCRETPYSRGGWYEEDADQLMPLYRFYADLAPDACNVSRERLAEMLRANVRYYGAERLAALGVR